MLLEAQKALIRSHIEELKEKSKATSLSDSYELRQSSV